MTNLPVPGGGHSRPPVHPATVVPDTPGPPSALVKALPLLGVLVWALLSLGYARDEQSWGHVAFWVFLCVASAGAAYVSVDSRGPGLLTTAATTAAVLSLVTAVALIDGAGWPLLLVGVLAGGVGTLVWLPVLTELAERRAERVVSLRIEELRTARAAGQSVLLEPSGDPLSDALARRGIPGAVVAGHTRDVDGSWIKAVSLPPGARYTPEQLIDPAMITKLALDLQIPQGWRLDGALGRDSHEVAFRCQPVLVLPPQTRHPILDVEEVDVWDALILGTNKETGEVVSRNVLARHSGILYAGVPNAGKSTALQGGIAPFALGGARLWLADPQQGKELGVWRDVAVCMAVTIEEANEMLAEYREAIEKIMRQLEAAGKRENSKELGLEVNALIIDEFERYTSHEDLKQRQIFNKRFSDILSRQRAAAGFAIAGTQNPDGRLLPTYLRQKITLRVALRCSEPAQVDAVFGKGESRFAPAHKISEDCPGEGYLRDGSAYLSVGGWPMSDADLTALTTRARECRPVAEPVELDARRRVVALWDGGRGLSQRQIAEKTGISRSTVQRMIDQS